MVVAGNGQGVCGVGKARSVSLRASLQRAKSRAFLHLISFNLKENRTRKCTLVVSFFYVKMYEILVLLGIK